MDAYDLALKLNLFEQPHNSHPYSLPYLAYLELCQRTMIPIRAIILAESPYKTNIYPSVVAAPMSFDLAKSVHLYALGRAYDPIPPTATFLAMDAYTHADVDISLAIKIIAEGYKLIKNGILIFNQGVFGKDPNKRYRESVLQSEFIADLIIKRGHPNGVICYSLGKPAGKFAQMLDKYLPRGHKFKEQYKVDHPASLSWQGSKGLDDPNWRGLGNPKFTKSLWNLILSNDWVAICHANFMDSSNLSSMADSIADGASKIVANGDILKKLLSDPDASLDLLKAAITDHASSILAHSNYVKLYTDAMKREPLHQPTDYGKYAKPAGGAKGSLGRSSAASSYSGVGTPSLSYPISPAPEAKIRSKGKKSSIAGSSIIEESTTGNITPGLSTTSDGSTVHVRAKSKSKK